MIHMAVLPASGHISPLRDAWNTSNHKVWVVTGAIPPKTNDQSLICLGRLKQEEIREICRKHGQGLSSIPLYPGVETYEMIAFALIHCLLASNKFPHESHRLRNWLREEGIEE